MKLKDVSETSLAYSREVGLDPIDVIGTVIGFFTKTTQLPRGELEGGIGCQR